jgi:hypothetical protein
MNFAVKKIQNLLSNRPRISQKILEEHGKTILIDQEFNTVTNEITILLSLLVKQ